MGLLIDPIREDLGLTDSEIGLLGLGFGLFYAVMALPFGWLADRMTRVRILAVAVLIWSAMTALGGGAQSFIVLFIARIGVGFGEAAMMPCCSSLLADYFRPERLPIAMSCFIAAGLFGASFAFVAGGWVYGVAMQVGPVDLPLLGNTMPWQTTLLFVGFLGLFVSAMLLLTREPQRIGRSVEADSPGGVSFREGFAFLWGRRWLILQHNLGFGFAGVYTFAMFLWGPTFLSRIYGWTMVEAGAAFGLAMMVPGILGIFTAGWLASWLMKRGHADAPMLIAIGGLVLLLPVAVAAPLMPSGEAAIVLIAVSMFFFSFPVAMPQVSLQLITPNELRGRTIGLLTIATNAIGMSIGPMSVAFLNDRVFSDPQAINLSLAIVSGASIGLATLFLAMALPQYRKLAVNAAKER